MKPRKNSLPGFLALVLAVLALLAVPAIAQHAPLKTDSRILYHDGAVMDGLTNVYFILYGCWRSSSCGSGNDTATVNLLLDFVTSLGGSPYMMINTTYPDYSGAAPNSGVVFGGSTDDLYSHSATLTDADVQDLIYNKILTGQLPQDSQGVYIVLATSDIYVDGFCYNFGQYHGSFIRTGIGYKYAFIGNPLRCPTSVAPQFVAPDGSRLPTPNNDFAADAMVSSMAHVLSEAVTNPYGDGWFDRYGLENSDKCQGTFGQTYTTANGAQANVKLGIRDYLIQQNWVNDRKGYCGLSIR